MMKRIFATADWYLPGFKAGGPPRSISNIITELGQAGYEFFLLTRDRDIGDSFPYPNLKTNTWLASAGGHIFYTADISLSNIRRRIVEVSPDIIYLNSFFSRISVRVLMLRRLGRLPEVPVVLAPRGEFSPGALALKKTKKRSYLRFIGLAGLYDGLLWHASSPREKEEIGAILRSYKIGLARGSRTLPPIHVASNIPGHATGQEMSGKALAKQSGQARFLFISRISPKKNVIMAIEQVARLAGDVCFDIYGPVEDQRYFARCQEAMAKLPPNVKVRYMGALPYEEARQRFSEYHFFLFPTLGENFGHVIVESWTAGCPVVLSDQTPWLDLENKGVGWDLALEDLPGWAKVLARCVEMDGPAYREMSGRARRFAAEICASPAIREENINLFRYALAERGY